MVLGGLLWGLLHEVGAQPPQTEGLKAFGICVPSAESRRRTEQFATWVGCSVSGQICRGKAARDGAVSGIASTAWVQTPLQGGLCLEHTSRARGHGDMGTWGRGDMGTWGHRDSIPQYAVGAGEGAHAGPCAQPNTSIPPPRSPSKPKPKAQSSQNGSPEPAPPPQ